MANALGGASGALTGAAAGSALLPGIGTAVGGIIGGLAGLFGGGDDESEELRAKALKILEDAGVAPDLSNPVAIQALQQGGFFTPELVQKLPLNADQKTELIEDSKNKQEQQYSLNALKEMSQTGLTAVDRAAMNKLRNQVAGDTQAKVNQILQEQQMRGQASGGNTLAAQLASIQNAQQNESEEADRIAANAAQARRDALAKFTGLATEMRGTELGKQKYNLENELARQKFLDNNSLARQTANVEAMNRANASNLERQQSVLDTNTQMRNRELYRQNEAKRQKWVDDMDRAKALSNVYTGAASAESQRAANQAASNQSMISAGMGGIKDLAQSFGVGSTPKYSTGVSKAVNPTGTAADQINALDGFRMAHGGRVPGHKILPGDTILNDTVDIKATPGEVIIPASHAHDEELAKAFIKFHFKKEKEELEGKK